ncbi:MAG: UDP-N-acetylglucosamine 1-carboxyvinyltransferase [bacterium]|nr:UDP-N-acetylglucosamine 1-carboxyvinyltransferase [bacterium]
MDKFIITGGNPLKGTVKISGAKNCALKVVVAGLYAADPIVLRNMPNLSDTRVMLQILTEFGAETTFVGDTVTVRSQQLVSNTVSLENAAKCKTSTLAFGPLLNLTGEAHIPDPGGDKIGKRPIDRYIDGLRALGATVNYEDGYFHAFAPKGLIGNTFRFSKNTHVGTEMMVLATVCAKGTSVIENAAQEPEIDDLISLLNKMGGQIERIEPRTIRAKGVPSLHGAEHSIMGDRLEAATFICAAMATNGEVELQGIDWMIMSAFLQKVEESGWRYELTQNGLKVRGDRLAAVDVTTEIYPGFNTDCQSPWCVAMTQAEGTSIIHETIHEARFGYVKELQKMGAHIELYRPEVENPDTVYNFNLSDDHETHPHAARITGPTLLHAFEVDAGDIRAGATLVIAALCADGVSTVTGVHHIERGYENFVSRFNSLGAKIEVVEIP